MSRDLNFYRHNETPGDYQRPTEDNQIHRKSKAAMCSLYLDTESVDNYVTEIERINAADKKIISTFVLHNKLWK